MDWPEPWIPVIEPREAAAFRDELGTELSAGHPLYGLPLRLLGRRWGDTWCLIAVEDGSDRVAMVDLRWTRQQMMPPLPCASLYENAEEWFRQTAWSEHRARHKPDPGVRPKFRVGDRVFMLKHADWKRDAYGTIIRVGRPLVIGDGSTQVEYEIRFDSPQSDLTDELYGLDLEYSGTTVVEKFLRPLAGLRAT